MTRAATSDEQELLADVLREASVHIEEPRSPDEMPSGGAVIEAHGDEADALRDALGVEQKAENEAAADDFREELERADDESEAIQIAIEAVADGAVTVDEAKDLLTSLEFDEDDSPGSNAPEELNGDDNDDVVSPETNEHGELSKAEQKADESRPGELTEMQKSVMRGMPKGAKIRLRAKNRRRRREQRESEQGNDHFDETVQKSGTGPTISESLGIPTDGDRDAGSSDGEKTLGDVVRIP